MVKYKKRKMRNKMGEMNLSWCEMVSLCFGLLSFPYMNKVR